MLGLKVRIAGCATVLLAAFASPVFAANLVLITAEEARLPPQGATVQFAARGVTRGPSIEVLLPAAAALHSPIRLQIKFEAHGGAKVVPENVQATYLRMPNVNLTERLKPYLTETGIDVPVAEVPPGEHTVRLDVSDSEGRKSTASFLLKIEP